MRRDHRTVIVAFLVLGAVTSCGAGATGDPGGTGGDAACAAPITEVSDTTVAPGESVVVTAADMWDECIDHDSVAVGEPVDRRTREPRPLTAEPVVWEQNSQDCVLTHADADSDGVIELSVTSPADAQRGKAEIRIGDAEPATIAVEARNR